MLGQIDGPAASNALAALAVYNASPDVRGRAIETLARRDPRDVIGRLIGLVRKPFKYDVRRPGGPGTTGELFVEGERFNVHRFYRNASLDPSMIPARIFAQSVPFDPFSVQNQLLVSAAYGGGMTITPTGPAPGAAQLGQALAANPRNAASILKDGTTGAPAPPGAAFNPSSNVVYQTLAAAAYRDMQIASAYQAVEQSSQNLQQRLALDIQAVETVNAQIGEVNGRALAVLRMISGQVFGAEPEKWKTWWTDQLGYVYQSNIPEIKPTLIDAVTVSPRKPVPTDTVAVTAPFLIGTCHTACFAAGTMVSTLDGPRDRIDPRRRPRPFAGHDDRRAGLPAGGRPPSQPADADVPDRR